MTGLDDISQLYLVTEPVDFRKGIDGLGTYVQSILNTDPFQNAMFVFTNKRHNKLKFLHYDGTGFWLLHKQLSKGTFKWRMNSLDPFLEISQQQLDWLLEGLDINQKRAFRPVKPQYGPMSRKRTLILESRQILPILRKISSASSLDSGAHYPLDPFLLPSSKESISDSSWLKAHQSTRG